MTLADESRSFLKEALDQLQVSDEMRTLVMSVYRQE